VFSKQNLSAPGKLGVLGEDLNVNIRVDLDYTSFLDSIDRHFPNGAVETTLLFETSRGCWWGEHSHCTFCGLNGSTMLYRSMAPENTLALFDSLLKFGVFGNCRGIPQYIVVDEPLLSPGASP
jgi:radical SAM superfamily enzyme YgiQ (UPF0313 family)